MNLRRFYPSLLKTFEYKRHQDRLSAVKHAGQRKWGGRAGKPPWYSAGATASQVEWPQYIPAGPGLAGAATGRFPGPPPSLMLCCREQATEPCADGTPRRAAPFLPQTLPASPRGLAWASISCRKVETLKEAVRKRAIEVKKSNK